MARLKRAGWLRVIGKRGGSNLVEALTSPVKVEALAETPLAGVKRRLTHCIKAAEKGRRSGLALQMGQTLRDLEKDLREIRESL